MRSRLSHQLPAPLTSQWDWQLSARCRHADPDLFFPTEDENRNLRLRREKVAKQFCSSCPVKRECRCHAITVGEPFGVWGGTSERDRRYPRADHENGLRNRQRPRLKILAGSRAPGH
ncbi:WhiB family transcriptional regulator [Rhodococcus sp. NCIMB 12038]|uniref:WhiB family transcriptional regulator n=1 Tax=Rhodococcus sp. NCIMB 12038 TaxID=933800 RepID=UPI000B3C2440|nr:WhiB family transcriptional regulator [Rhodococcus sp. NCIMB 12038]OUS88587.1 hypothetical protein CA951_37755 [Rhodococcus sp. NCIMB 12038]